MIFGGIRASEEPRGESKSQKKKKAQPSKEKNATIWGYIRLERETKKQKSTKKEKVAGHIKKAPKTKAVPPFDHVCSKIATVTQPASQPRFPFLRLMTCARSLQLRLFSPVLTQLPSKVKEERRIVVLLQPLCLRKMPRRCVVISLPRMVCVMNRRET